MSMQSQTTLYPDNLALENISCPNHCPPNDEKILSGKDFLNGIEGQFSTVRCKTCGLERTNPRPTADTIGIYYPDSYAPYQSQTALLKQKFTMIKRIMGFEFRVLPNTHGKRMLEIGCSSGNYMQEVRADGWIVDGIEFSEAAANIARQKGFNVQVSSLEKALPPLEKYDVITAWMVLEHLHEPVDALRKASEWIKPDGYLVLLVPSAKSLSRKIFNELSYDIQLPTHLFHYTPQTLEKVLHNAGWEIEKIRWQKNANTLIKSTEYWAEDKKIQWLLNLLKWFSSSKVALPLRLMLAWVLGVTRQSGRIEVWARPIN